MFVPIRLIIFFTRGRNHSHTISPCAFIPGAPCHQNSIHDSLSNVSLEKADSRGDSIPLCGESKGQGRLTGPPNIRLPGPRRLPTSSCTHSGRALPEPKPLQDPSAAQITQRDVRPVCRPCEEQPPDIGVSGLELGDVTHCQHRRNHEFHLAFLRIEQRVQTPYGQRPGIQ